MSVRYEVILDVPPDRAEVIVRYMREVHIPAILETGCFLSIRFDRASDTRYRTTYEAGTRAELEKYLKQHAERFRADFREQVGQGVVPAREVWEEVAGWEKGIGE